jgi:hypothetical protein
MKRGLEDKYVEAVEAALSITPCQAVVVSDFADAPIGLRFAPMVIRSDDDVTALAVARHWALSTGRPLLVIGQADFLDAIYPDGHTESVQAEANAISN